MRRCRFLSAFRPHAGASLRRPLQIYEKYPGFETKAISFFSKPPGGVPCRPLLFAVYLYTYIIPAKPGGFAGNSAALRDGSRPGRLRGYPFRSRCFDKNLRTGSSYSLRHSHARITEPKKSARAPGSDSRNVRSPFLTQA